MKKTKKVNPDAERAVTVDKNTVQVSKAEKDTASPGHCVVYGCTDKLLRITVGGGQDKKHLVTTSMRLCRQHARMVADDIMDIIHGENPDMEQCVDCGKWDLRINMREDHIVKDGTFRCEGCD